MYPQSQGYPQGPGYQQNYQPGFQPNFQTGAGYPGGYPPQQPAYQPGPTVNMHLGPGQPSGGSGYGFNNSEPMSGPFAEKAIRNAFVSKVYAILSIQLTFTSILIGVFVLNNDIKTTFMRSGQGWAFLGLGIFFIAYMILACIESARRSFPLNFILLGVLTLGYGLVAAIISCRYNTHIVLFAFVATALSTILITLLAKTTSFDMTSCGTTLCLLGLAHAIIGTIMMLILASMGYGKLGSLILAVSGAFLVSLYLMFDTQLILGGRKMELSPEEYILGAILLYVDIVQLFIYLLEIFNRISDD